jgi:hypothetical protein
MVLIPIQPNRWNNAAEEALRDPRKRRLVGDMASSPAELREVSVRLLAHSAELRRTAEFARKHGIECREAAQVARTHAETCRIHAEAAASVLRIQYRTEPRRMPSLQSHVMSETATSAGVEMPTKHTDQDVAARLQELYHKDDIARAVFDDAAERTYVVAKTSIDRIARIAGTTRAKAGDLCMVLDVIGVATIKQAHMTGGYKFPTRLHWRYVPRSIGLVAKGEKETLQGLQLAEAGEVAEDAMPLNGANQPAANRFIEYRFPLCENRIAILRLPIDLTKAEVDRLSRFMAALAQPE